MHQYMTRRLVAKRPMTYAEWPLQPGDEFCATPVDAAYLIRCGKAAEPEEHSVQPIPVAETVEITPEVIEPAPTIEPEPAQDAEPEERPKRRYTRRAVATAE